ncbi:hypothetical protein [Oryzicola mucosus]|uniref:Uncharacterized protein n=1 Tax=Oryzicola mucosus TaxID=2767425 RepID=A0A8J6Q479_9HYPH|nr:hypothetical protein [Oryzicola mucosus]MBD0415775.1 hypothetical protein [Oryzicola mucosus]
MRLFFLVVLVAGLAVGVAYPWAAERFLGEQLGVWRVHDTGGAFEPVTVTLRRQDFPVRVMVDVTAPTPPAAPAQQTTLTLTAAQDGRTVLAEKLRFADATARETSPQNPVKIFRDEAGIIEDEAPGTYVFTIGEGDAEGIDIQEVDLVLRSMAVTARGDARRLGLAVAGIGFFGFVAAWRIGRRRDKTPPPAPPKPRWGRGGPQA